MITVNVYRVVVSGSSPTSFIHVVASVKGGRFGQESYSPRSGRGAGSLHGDGPSRLAQPCGSECSHKDARRADGQIDGLPAEPGGSLSLQSQTNSGLREYLAGDHFLWDE